MKNLYFLFVVSLLLIVGFIIFYNPKSNENERFDEAETEILSLYIAAEKAPCEDNEEELCLRTREFDETEESATLTSLDGFTYSEGVEYEVEVEKDSNNNYKFLEVMRIQNPNPSKLVDEAAYPIETIPSKIETLSTKTLVEGAGDVEVQSTDSVLANYRGWLSTTGEIFDSSFKNGSSDGISFPLNGVISGWTEGLQGMKIGEVRRLYIPSNMGYGETGSGAIPPGADLIFDVELMGIL